MVGRGRYQWVVNGAERWCVSLTFMLADEDRSWFDPRDG